MILDIYIYIIIIYIVSLCCAYTLNRYRADQCFFLILRPLFQSWQTHKPPSGKLIWLSFQKCHFFLMGKFTINLWPCPIASSHSSPPLCTVNGGTSKIAPAPGHRFRSRSFGRFPAVAGAWGNQMMCSVYPEQNRILRWFQSSDLDKLRWQFGIY